MSELQSAWENLFSERRTEPGWHGRRIFPAAPCRIHAAVRPGRRERGILFEVPAAAVPATVEYPACGGFVLSPEPIIGGPGGLVRLVLEERSPAYADLFSAMAGDVCAAVAASDDNGTAVRSLLARLEKWVRFASRFGPGHLSQEACLGLAAELLFLEADVLTRLPAAAALRAWVGPEGAAQDFRFERCHVEVKGSASASPPTIRISNLEQLDGALGVPLFLCHLSLAANGSGGRCLPEIVADIRRAIDEAGNGALERLEELLHEAGYLDVHAPRYLQPAYAIHTTRFFQVLDGFPRLTPSSVAKGVVTATYSISLSACAPWTVAASECVRLIQNPEASYV